MEIIFPLTLFFILILFRVRISYALLSVSILFPILNFDTNISYFKIVGLNIFKVFENDILIMIPFFVFFGVLIKNSKLSDHFLIFIEKKNIKNIDIISFSFFGILIGMSVSIAGSALIILNKITDVWESRKSIDLKIQFVAAYGTLAQLMPPSLALIILYNSNYGIFSLSNDLFFSKEKITILDFYTNMSIVAVLLSLVYLIFFLNHDGNLKKKSDRTKKYNIFFVILFFLFFIVTPIFTFSGIVPPQYSIVLACLLVTISILFFSKNQMETLFTTVDETIKISSYVFLLIIASTIFSLFLNYFYFIEIDFLFYESLLLDIFIYCLIIIILGFFLEFIEISIVFVPIFLAYFLKTYSINPIDFLILTGLLLQLSFLTPPFGWTIFYLSGLYPKISTKKIISLLLPINFMLIIFIVLFIFFVFL